MESFRLHVASLGELSFDFCYNSGESFIEQWEVLDLGDHKLLLQKQGLLTSAVIL